MSQENEATLNKFKFPIDKGGEHEDFTLRDKVALKLLSSITYADLKGARQAHREASVRAAFDWADTFLSMRSEAHTQAKPEQDKD